MTTASHGQMEADSVPNPHIHNSSNGQRDGLGQARGKDGVTNMRKIQLSNNTDITCSVPQRFSLCTFMTSMAVAYKSRMLFGLRSMKTANRKLGQWMLFSVILVAL